MAQNLQSRFEDTVVRRVAARLCKLDCEQGTSSYDWYQVMGWLWIDLGADECRNVDTWLELLQSRVRAPSRLIVETVSGLSDTEEYGHDSDGIGED